jgi:hypothetical protein
MSIPSHASRLLLLLIGLAFLFPSRPSAQTSNEACLDCHDDETLVSEHGTPVGIVAARFTASIHADLDCADCHSSGGDYDDVPHFAHYTPVDCSVCHDDAAADYATSVHHAGRKRNGGAATCTTCHGTHYVLAIADSTSPANARNIPTLCGECHAQRPPVTADFVRLPVVVPGYLESVHGRGWLHGEPTARTVTVSVP